jgi:hypothetical protein
MAEAKAGTRRISDDTVRSKTGKGWDEWYALIDRSDVRDEGHTAIAKYLRDEQRVSAWWAQAVTVRYEYERGLR